MSVLLETPNLRLLSPTEVFGGRFRHMCHAGCGNELVVPAQDSPRQKLEDGDIWTCNRCFAKHEYYMAYTPGVRHACVRLLVGRNDRTEAEPTVGEFVQP